MNDSMLKAELRQAASRVGRVGSRTKILMDLINGRRIRHWVTYNLGNYKIVFILRINVPQTGLVN